jgi:hypothetical protein
MNTVSKCLRGLAKPLVPKKESYFTRRTQRSAKLAKDEAKLPLPSGERVGVRGFGI